MNSTDKIGDEMVEPAPFPLDILVDIDGIVADLHTPWLQVYNEEWDDNLTVENLTTFEIEQVVKKDCGRDIYKYLTPELFNSLKPMPGAAEAIRFLRKRKHRVKCCTSAASNPDTAGAKLRWIKKTIGIGRTEVFVCHDKDWIQAHVFIEDSPHNLRKYKSRNPDATTMTIEYPYSKEAINHGWVDFNAGSYRQPQAAWDRIVEEIDVVSRRHAAPRPRLDTDRDHNYDP